MRDFKKKLLIPVLAISLVFSLSGPITVSAATTPSLNQAYSYAILGGTYTNTSAATSITGDIGFTTGPATAPLGVHTNYGSGAPTPAARIDAASALSVGLATQVCTFTFAGGPIDLATDTTHGPVGVYTPGVYCNTGAMTIGTGGITLDGAGTYIFRTDGALTTADNSTVTLSGASACDVFWTPTAATTLGATTNFVGTIIDNANAITVGANTIWSGRALSLGAGVVTTGDTSSISVPICTPPTASINVVKTVINDDGRNGTIANFPLFVNGSPVVSGVTNIFPSPATYIVTETPDPDYTQTFSGDCDVNGSVSLVPGENKFCIITNNDTAIRAGAGSGSLYSRIPPLIDVVKVPNPLVLPSGGGSVLYTYTLTNIGTIPVTDITMVGDTCSPIILASGDSNSDFKLDLNETWEYTCSTTLSETHTNTVVTTGWGNGISTTDIASATVVVGLPVVPPLIHVTKTPNPLILPASGGIVTYTEVITNPGTVALNNVRLTDDKCSPMQYISGDSNGDSKLDVDEWWTYTCQSNISDTTMNTATASGEANGLTVRDLAIATVVVSAIVPALPDTGLPSYLDDQWKIVALVEFLILVSAALVIALRKRTI